MDDYPMNWELEGFRTTEVAMQLDLVRLRLEDKEIKQNINYDLIYKFQELLERHIKPLEILSQTPGSIFYSIFDNPLIATLNSSKKRLEEYGTLSNLSQEMKKGLETTIAGFDEFDQKGRNCPVETIIKLRDFCTQLSNYEMDYSESIKRSLAA